MRFYRTIILVAVLSIPIFGESAPKDEAWITVSGRVVAATADYFILDKGSKTVTVEMDDWDWYKEGYKILPGDDVVVQGRIDNDFLEARKIEADSVYVKGMNTQYFASADDEEGVNEQVREMRSLSTTEIPEGTHLKLTGTIRDIDGRLFTLQVGTKEIRVDTRPMLYNPFDRRGVIRLQEGDRVRVSGVVEQNFFSENELNASQILRIVHE